MPRRVTSSANSRGVQWLLGHPNASGGSQASAMIWHHCSGLKASDVPSRGALVSARAGQAQLAWNAPTTNTDGTTLTNLAGYKLLYW
jgi:hypothetical protein